MLTAVGLVWALLSACAPPECEGPDCDGDGIDDVDDCDDFDPALGDRALDSDCDGVLAPGDCDDRDPGVTRERPEGLEAQGISFASVCAGEFTMGCTSGQLSVAETCPADETPAHSVSFESDLWVATTPVTQAQWFTVMGTSPAALVGCDECPVESVTWWEALAFANALSVAEGLTECYRLDACAQDASESHGCLRAPSRVVAGGLVCTGFRLLDEAEWEYAARAGGDAPFAGGSDVGAVAWGIGSALEPQPVAALEPNDWGLYDLSGNVWEWTWDRYGSSYYSVSPTETPTGPDVGLGRVIRGGSYASDEQQTRLGARAYFAPGTRSAQVGFRVARPIPQE